VLVEFLVICCDAVMLSDTCVADTKAPRFLPRTITSAEIADFFKSTLIMVRDKSVVYIQIVRDTIYGDRASENTNRKRDR
jgi:hypothetical protein